MIEERSSGLLLHITSLPGKYGIGTMGREAYAFIQFLIESGQKRWQILPLGHTGYGDSPYQSFSAFAGNPLLIDLDRLVEQKLLSEQDLPVESFDHESVDYGAVYNYKYPLLKTAYQNFGNTSHMYQRVQFENFCHNNKAWLDDYAFFMAIKADQGGKSWTEWEHHLKFRDYDTLNWMKERLADDIHFYRFVQYLFYHQWLELKSYANNNNIKIIGDIPLYVAFDSADAWANPELFEFDDQLNPTTVAGVPPDYFSDTGQLWGNPIYNWSQLKASGYQWWIDRIRSCFTLYDILRIDHFRGLAAYWAVPYGEQTAINGQWIEAPGREMLETVFENLGELPIIAEDLGVITPDVTALRDYFGMPGMKILQFAFDSAEDNMFIPYSYDNNSVVYTGTHDNDTTLGHFLTSTEDDKQRMRDYFQIDEADPAWSYLRLAWSTVSNIAIAPLQDILRLDTNARMNYPGRASGFWRWRYKKEMLTSQHAADLMKLTKLYGRW